MTRNFLLSKVICLTLILLFIYASAVFAPVAAESGVGNDVFKVIVTLFGITNSTKDIVTLVNVADQTKVKLFNAENPETEGQDKVSYVETFPNLRVDDNEPYKVCTIKIDGFKIDCQTGKNSPLNRPEFVDIDVSEQGGVGSAEQKQKQ